MATNTTLANAYVIGPRNFQAWSQNYDVSGYLKVLPHPDQTVIFNDPYRDWQLDKPGNYISSWGAATQLNATLTMANLPQVKIDGFGILQAGDGKISWLGNKATPYEELRAYNGTIPGPMLITEPGDTLNLTVINNLDDPTQISNLHTHGLHTSPLGDGDNVLVSVAPGGNLNYSIKIPTDSSIGPDWYHPHLHGLTNEQVSSGLAGALIVNAPYNLPDLSKLDPKTVPTHIFEINSFGVQQVLRNGAVGDPLNQNLTTPVPAGTPLKILGTSSDGQKQYQLSDAPFMGYNGKTLDAVYDPTKPTGDRANNKFEYGGGPQEQPVENVIHTVNGQYNPTLTLTTGEWNVFSFINMNSQAFHVLQLVKDDPIKGLIPITMSLVGIDGDTSSTVPDKRRDVTTLPILSPGSRLTIQEWFNDPGTYYLLSNATSEILGDNAPSLTKSQGFADGHLTWGSQVLTTIQVTGTPTPTGTTPQPFDISTAKAKKIDDFVSAVKKGDVTQERTFTWSANLGGAITLGQKPDDADAKTFEGTYGINSKYFSHNFIDSMVPLAMPMLGTKEIWTIKNTSGSIDPTLKVNLPLLEWHPFHIHQNDFSVIAINGISVDKLPPQYNLNGYLSDTVNLPPTYAPGSATVNNPYGTPQIKGVTSEVKLAMNFEDYPGTFVDHCHILFHEDAGMMAPVRVVLNTEKTWVGLDSKDNTNGQVYLVRANDLQKTLSLTPYGTAFTKSIEVASGDINYKNSLGTNNNVTDNVTDVVTIQSSLEKTGDKFTVKVFDGQALINQQVSGKNLLDGQDPTTILSQINPFQNITTSTQQIATVAVGDINSDGFADIIVGIGGGIAPQIEIYSGQDSKLISRLSPFHHEAFTGKINLAVGDVNGDNYDDIIVAQGAGGTGLVEIYSGDKINSEGSLDGKTTAHHSELLSQVFQPYGTTYTGEVDVTSGYILQRPETPNGKPNQTYHANITTLAKGKLPADSQQVNVWTYIGSSDPTAMAHSMDSMAAAPTPEVRQDIGFTPNDPVEEILGTFADIPKGLRGEPGLFARTQNGAYEFIHLKEGNVPEIIPLSPSGTPSLTQNSNNGILSIKTNGNGKPKLKINLKQTNFNQVNELGVFAVDDAEGKINGIAPGASGYAEAALKRGRGIFSTLFNNPQGFSANNLTRILDFDFADNFRFYMVNNSSSDAVLSGATSITNVVFADPSTQKITDLGNNGLSLVWKDNNGNNTDALMVTLQSTNDSLTIGTALQGKPQGEVIDLRDITGQVKADFAVNREAALNDFVGFYTVVDENGGIDTNGDGKADILPGQSDYVKTAVSGRIADINLAVDNQGTAISSGNFRGGSIIVPFIIVDGNPQAILNGNSGNNLAIYFPFLGANSDKQDHLRLLGGNIFGFEDLPNGGDKDYNDIIVSVKLSST